MVSPVPPPFGGISRWTLLMHQYVNCQQEVRFIQVNTANRWRKIDDLAIWKRLLFGMFQLFFNYIKYLSALLKNPDVIHLTTSGGIGSIRDLVICATARIFHFPVVYHIRFGRIPEISSKKTVEWHILTIALRLANQVITIDKSTADAISIHLPRISVNNIPNPIDFSNLPVSGKKEIEQNCVLFVGWIIPTKGIEELVQAWSALSPQKWVMLLVGPGDHAYRQELMIRYNTHDLEFLDELTHDDAMQLIAKCDIFVLPSHTEGFPNAVLEAMALSKPVIASSVGAIPEMLSEDCGVLVEPKNVEELKNALSMLIHDKPLRIKLGENARNKAKQKYSMDVVFAKYVDVWQKLCMR